MPGRITQAAPCLLAKMSELVDDFYDQILQHPTAARVITGGDEQIDRLKTTLRRWIREILSGPYDRDYVMARLAVGRRHVTVGLDQAYANAALARLRNKMQMILAREWQGRPDDLLATTVALNRRLDLDTIIIQDAYQTEFLAQQQKAQ